MERRTQGKHLSPMLGMPGHRLTKLIVFPTLEWLAGWCYACGVGKRKAASWDATYLDGAGGGAAGVAGAGAVSFRSGGEMPSAFKARSIESHTAVVG